MVEPENIIEMQEYAEKQERHAKLVADLLKVYPTPEALFEALFIKKIFANNGGDAHNIGKQIKQSLKYALNTGGNYFTTSTLNKMFKSELEKLAPKTEGIGLTVSAQTDYCFLDILGKRGQFNYQANRSELGKSTVTYTVETDGLNYPHLSLYELIDSKPLDIHVRVTLDPRAENGRLWPQAVSGKYLWNPKVSCTRQDLWGSVEALGYLLNKSKTPQQDLQSVEEAFKQCDQMLQRWQQSAISRGEWYANLLEAINTPFEDMYRYALDNAKSGMFSNRYKKKAKSLVGAMNKADSMLLNAQCLFEIEKPAEYRQELFLLRRAFWGHYYKSGMRQRFERYLKELFEEKMNQEYKIHYHIEIAGENWKNESAQRILEKLRRKSTK